MGKRYYWLKLKDDFFNDKKIKKLRKIAGGDTYTIIYLKLMLTTLDNDGIYEYEGIEEHLADEIALTLDEDADNVEITLNYLMQSGLMVELDNNNFELPMVKESIGAETASAKRVRAFRERQKALQCNTNVTQVKQNVNGDIDIDIEKDIEKDNIYNQIPYAEIIDYLNKKCGTAYRTTSRKSKGFIKARYEEGFTLDDFKKVIDNKAAEWLNTDMCKYLRPETLFGNKFEGYLNQKKAIAKGGIEIDSGFRNFLAQNEVVDFGI